MTTPVDAGTYGLNVVANADYSCNDGVNGTGFATCAGPVRQLARRSTPRARGPFLHRQFERQQGQHVLEDRHLHRGRLTDRSRSNRRGPPRAAGHLHARTSRSHGRVPVSVQYNTGDGTATRPPITRATTGTRTFAASRSPLVPSAFRRSANTRPIRAIATSTCSSPASRNGLLGTNPRPRAASSTTRRRHRRRRARRSPRASTRPSIST